MVAQFPIPHALEEPVASNPAHLIVQLWPLAAAPLQTEAHELRSQLVVFSDHRCLQGQTISCRRKNPIYVGCAPSFQTRVLYHSPDQRASKSELFTLKNRTLHLKEIGRILG
jgi:hypothetical protein